jgi:hypothetical protein
LTCCFHIGGPVDTSAQAGMYEFSRSAAVPLVCIKRSRARHAALADRRTCCQKPGLLSRANSDTLPSSPLQPVGWMAMGSHIRLVECASTDRGGGASSRSCRSQIGLRAEVGSARRAPLVCRLAVLPVFGREAASRQRDSPCEKKIPRRRLSVPRRPLGVSDLESWSSG